MAHIVIIGATPSNSEPSYEKYVLKTLGIARLADNGRS
jgi:hypothetical protein